MRPRGPSLRSRPWLGLNSKSDSGNRRVAFPYRYWLTRCSGMVPHFADFRLSSYGIYRHPCSLLVWYATRGAKRVDRGAQARLTVGRTIPDIYQSTTPITRILEMSACLARLVRSSADTFLVCARVAPVYECCCVYPRPLIVVRRI